MSSNDETLTGITLNLLCLLLAGAKVKVGSTRDPAEFGGACVLLRAGI